MKIWLVVLFAAMLHGQIGVIRPFEPPISEPLRQYLELTSAQVTSISSLTGQLVRYQAEKTQRMAQVHVEIAAEMGRNSLDPMALGMRYVELEVIRRELTAEARRVAEETQKLYTPAQRTKIVALQEVLRQYPLACEALQRNLMPPPEQPQPGFAQFLLTSYVLPACPVGGLRAGGFGPGLPGLVTHQN